SFFNTRRGKKPRLSAESQAVRRRELRNSSKMASQKSERTAADLSRCRPPELQIMLVASPRNQPFSRTNADSKDAFGDRVDWANRLPLKVSQSHREEGGKLY